MAVGILISAALVAAVADNSECAVERALFPRTADGGVARPGRIAAFPVHLASSSRLAGFIPFLADPLHASRRDVRELSAIVADRTDWRWSAACAWKGTVAEPGMSYGFMRPVVTRDGRLALIARSAGGADAAGVGIVCMAKRSGPHWLANCTPLWVR